MVKKPKWTKKLSARELKHIAETSASSKPTLRAFQENRVHQKAQGIVCYDCDCIATKLGIE